MSNALTTLVPILDGSNYLVWAHQMKAYLQSMELWEMTNNEVPFPLPVLPPGTTQAPAPDNAMIELQNQWIKQSNRTLGNMMLCLTPPIQEQIANKSAPESWEYLATTYGVPTLSTVYQDFRHALNFCLDLAKHPGPQLDYLESIYNRLNTNKVAIPPTIQGMMMLNILPSKWESTLVPMALAGTTIAQMSLKAVKAFIINFWESEQNKRALPKAQKLSAIKRQNQQPSFNLQMQGGSWKPKEKKKKPIKRGTRCSKGKERATSHIASVASLPSPPLAHIASFSPAGLEIRTAHASLPAAGQARSPIHPTVMSARSLAERIGVETTTGNLKTLEQHITMPQHKFGGRITASKRSSTPPPSPPASTSASWSVADWDAQLAAERLHDEELYPQVMYEEHFGVVLPSIPNTPLSDCVSLFGDEDIELENWAR
jgi:hypothetical protein